MVMQEFCCLSLCLVFRKERNNNKPYITDNLNDTVQIIYTNECFHQYNDTLIDSNANHYNLASYWTD